jgi:glycerol-3-phosphate O-acyltransferase/dihydroxyacetone phosphate acyltransferase
LLEALAGSKVKIAGKDVVTTWKLLTALVVAPLLWLFYTLVVYTYFFFAYGSGKKAALVFLVLWPILSTTTVYISDLIVDIVKSIRPLIVSIGNVMSSSEPLREMRSDLQTQIRNMVNQFGPEVFPDFENTRIIKPGHPPNELSDVAALKLGRSESMDRSAIDSFVDESDSAAQIDSVFGGDLDRVDLDKAF